MINYKEAAYNIRKQLREYIESAKLQSLIIGLSGGIDSSLCAVLATPVVKSLGIPLLGRSITIETNKPDEIDRGIKTGNAFCDNFKEVNLTKAYHQLKTYTEEEFTNQEDDRATKIRLGNIKARIRMVYLYNLAQRYKGMVLSTDNYTELLLGFWTLHGDVGDYGMIQNLWKTEVYELAQYLVDNDLKTETEKQALQECIDAVPTDGLGITSSDLEQLQAKTYFEVDEILKAWLQNKEHAEHPVIRRHLSSEYKRNNPYNIPRKKIIN
ncbi:MAG: NAD(+) synthase [Marinilabiliales bacterium]|nr:MAG: NAD(+) synthase [Marinilabiliales bacterium]